MHRRRREFIGRRGICGRLRRPIPVVVDGAGEARQQRGRPVRRLRVEKQPPRRRAGEAEGSEGEEREARWFNRELIRSRWRNRRTERSRPWASRKKSKCYRWKRRTGNDRAPARSRRLRQ